MKIADLAEAIGVDAANISRLETGKQKQFTEQTLSNIAKSLGVDIADLFTSAHKSNTVYKNSNNGGVMNYEIKQEDKRTVAGFHLVGPWEQTVKKGFEQLMMWVDSKNIVPKEWVAVYYDNPDETPAEKLRCDTVVTVPGYFTLPENSEGVILTEISGGQYAVAVARVVGDDFAKPWYQFFNSLLQDSAYEMLPKPCFEVYLNNGAEDGYWDIEMYVAVQPKHH